LSPTASASPAATIAVAARRQPLPERDDADRGEQVGGGRGVLRADGARRVD
jgi:hypothetical protein